MKADVLVIGAGTAGLVAALTLAEKGCDVLIVEQMPEDGFGNFWVNDLDTGSFERHDLPEPLPEELAFSVECDIRMATTDRKAFLTIPDMRNYALKMSFYQRRLLKLCLREGVRTLFGFEAVAFLHENSFVKGIAVRNQQNDEISEISSEIVILACGFNERLLDNIPGFCDFDFRHTPGDCIYSVQELWTVDKKGAGRTLEAGSLRENEMVFTCGLPGAGGFSMFLYRLDMQRKVIGLLAASRSQYKNISTPRRIIDDFKAEYGFCRERIYGGGRRLVLRYPSDILVDNGIALAGDAALLTNPANGSATTASLISGKTCARVAADILKSGKSPSKENLWEYNYRMQIEFGGLFSGYHLSQLLLRKLSEQDVQKLVKYRLIRGKDFYAIHENLPVNIGLLDGLSRIFSSYGALDLLAKFLGRGIRIRQIMKHYSDYPAEYDPATFAVWRLKSAKIRS